MALLLQGQQSSQDWDRGDISSAIIEFHQYRTNVAESLRLVLKLCLDEGVEEEFRDLIRERLGQILEDRASKRSNSPAYTQKCISALGDIESWLTRLAEQAQRYAAVGQASSPDHDEIISIQQQQLTQQHESLGAVICYLVKLNHTNLDNLRSLLAQLRQIDKWSSVVIHYIPPLISSFNQFGSATGFASHNEARTLFKSLVELRDSNPWHLRDLQAAVIVWLLAEYTSWYFDMPTDHVAIEDEDFEKEEQNRAEVLRRALQDGGFHCTLSVCSQIKSSDWYDPARIELIRSLLHDAPALSFEPAFIAPYFQDLVMEHFGVFSEAFITHMPDTLRGFKFEEEEQRRKLLSGFPNNAQNDTEGSDRHLERFFVIMSYAFEGRTEEASEFWADHDSNLYGFLQWFSARVSTPVIGAFCEMFRAISEGEECAASAHQFLLEGNANDSGRSRRSATLSWTQIFGELEFYASKVKDNPNAGASSSTSFNGKPKPVDIDEPETPAMLECYLRLIAHLCEQSQVVTAWVLDYSSSKIIDTTFLLCNNTVPSRIRASAYRCLTSLLKTSTPEVTNPIWTALDQWVSHGFSLGGSITRPARVTIASTWAEEVTFEAISSNFDEANSFVSLLTRLVSASVKDPNLRDSLPFPEQLGSSYRMPGIDPYVDLVLGRIFATKLPTLDVPQGRILSATVFGFVETCLETFNENLIVLQHRTGLELDNVIDASSLLAYVRFHPFSRVIEWLFNEKAIASMFQIAHQQINDVSSARSDSPLTLALLGCVRTMSMVMDLQSTYLDIVRPLIKTQSSAQRKPVSNPSLASFEDVVSMHLRLITDLAYYSTSGHQDLALASTDLLKKLAMSRKLNTPQAAKTGSRVISNRLIGILQGKNDVDPVAQNMIQLLNFDDQEVFFGESTSYYATKFAILDFVEHTLSVNPTQPSLAHSFLGFACKGTNVDVETGSAFAQHASLFHAILRLSVEYPGVIGDSAVLWASALRAKAARIIYLLWTSPLTSFWILPELQEMDFWTTQWSSTNLVNSNTLWQGVSVQDDSFFFEGGSQTLEHYVKERGYLYALSAAELRLATAEHSSLRKAQMVSTMFGVSIFDGVEEPNAVVFDLLDFLDLSNENGPGEPHTFLLEGVDLEPFIEVKDEERKEYNVDLLQELFSLKINHMVKIGEIPDQQTEERANQEKYDALAHFTGLNNSLSFEKARHAALSAWSDLVAVLVRNCSDDPSDRASLALQALQTVSPKLEYFATLNRQETHIFAELVQNILNEVEFQSTVLQSGRAGEIASDKLFELFKISLRAIGNPDTGAKLHESFYNICYRYLTSIVETSASSTRRQLGSQTIKAAGEGLIDTVCEDAYGAAGTCSIAALLFLDALARLDVQDNSQYVLESLVRSNFIGVLVETIQEMPRELIRADASSKFSPRTCRFVTAMANRTNSCSPPSRLLQSQTLPPTIDIFHPRWRRSSHSFRPPQRHPRLESLHRRSRPRPR